MFMYVYLPFKLVTQPLLLTHKHLHVMFSYSRNGAFTSISEIPPLGLPLSPKGFPEAMHLLPL